MPSKKPAKKSGKKRPGDGKIPSDAAILTPKQAAFCAEYLIDLNATQAAIRAGYSESTARQIAVENLSKPYIQAEVQRLMDARASKVDVSAERVLEELVVMAFYDPGDIVCHDINCPKDILKLPKNVRRCILGWAYDKHGNFVIKLASKTQQLELIGRHLKMFTDKTELSGRDGAPLMQGGTELSPEQIAAVERIRERRETAAKIKS